MPAKIREVSLIVLAILIFSACGNQNTPNLENLAEAGKSFFENSEFQIAFPQDWEILDQSNFSENIAKETVIAFRNNLKNEIFTANISITKNLLEKPKNSKALAIESLENYKNLLVEYKELSRNEFFVPQGGDNIETLIIQFEGKQSVSDPVIHFQQVNAASAKANYLLTAAFRSDESEDVVNKISETINSFRLK